MAYRYAVVIAENDTNSTDFALTLDDQCVIGMEIPSAITSTSIKIQGKGLDGQYKDVQYQDADYSLAVSANVIVPLDANTMAAVRTVRLVAASSEAAERTIQLIVREIS